MVQRTIITILTGILLLTSGNVFGQTAGDSDTPDSRASEPIGFASVGEGTTGGAEGAEVTVTSAKQLLEYATRDEPYVVNVVDTVDIIRGIGDFAEESGEYYLGSNTTLRGVTSASTIQYGGFRIADAENVIIKNLHFDGTYSGYDPDLEGIDCAEVPEDQHRYKNGSCLEPGDRAPTDNALEVRDGSERVWITRNSFERYSDEIMSVKTQASYVTLSWNRFDDEITGKNGMMILISSSDGHTEDRGRLKTTIHHNYMASRSRHPRIRFGQIHIFNNYYHNIDSYGIASTMDAEVLVENNYFENVDDPWHIGYGDSEEGYLINRNNIFVDTEIPDSKGELGVHVTDPADYYSYTPEDPEELPEKILEWTGAGK